MTLAKLREAKQILSTLAVVAAETGHQAMSDHFWDAYEALHNALVPLEKMVKERIRELDREKANMV